MKVNSRSHLYRYVPNYLNNRKLPREEQIVVNLNVIATPDDDAYQREALRNTRTFNADKAQELNEARLNTLYSEKFHSVENLEIAGFEGKEITFETFYSEAPPEMVNEILRVMRSTEQLSAGEQKNFLPESDGR